MTVGQTAFQRDRHAHGIGTTWAITEQTRKGNDTSMHRTSSVCRSVAFQRCRYLTVPAQSHTVPMFGQALLHYVTTSSRQPTPDFCALSESEKEASQSKPLLPGTWPSVLQLRREIPPNPTSRPTSSEAQRQTTLETKLQATRPQARQGTNIADKHRGSLLAGLPPPECKLLLRKLPCRTTSIFLENTASGGDARY